MVPGLGKAPLREAHLGTRVTHRVDALQPPLVGGQLCHERLVLQPFVVKVSCFIIGDILRCQQLVIDPESELCVEKERLVISGYTFLTRGSGQDLLPTLGHLGPPLTIEGGQAEEV